MAATTCSLQDVIESDLDRDLGRQPGQQPAGVHEVPLPGPPARLPGRGGQPVPRARPRPLLGAVQRRVGPVRHQDVRPARAGAARRRRGLRQRRAQAADRAGRGRRGLRRRAHRRAGTSSSPTSTHRPLDDLLAEAGLTRAQVEEFVDEYAAADAAILLWSMGITQHRDSVDGVRAIVNLGLARGNVGRDGAGLMPLRGHSGVQGGAEMGAYATAFPGGVDDQRAHRRELADAWGFAVPDRAGPDRARDARGRRARRARRAVELGRQLPRRAARPGRGSRPRSTGCRCGCTRTSCSRSQMLVPGDDVILLPVATRYEQEGGGTETTTERRIVFTPEIPRQVGEARSEWRLFADVATPGAARPGGRLRLARQPGAARGDRRRRAALRRHRDASAAPATRCSGAAATCAPAACSPPPTAGPGSPPVDAARRRRARGHVHGGHPAGQAVQLDGVDDDRPAHRRRPRRRLHRRGRRGRALGLADGRRGRAALRRTARWPATSRLVRLPRRSLQVHWPEGNVLLPAGPEHREPGSQVPDYNAVVTLDAR